MTARSQRRPQPARWKAHGVALRMHQSKTVDGTHPTCMMLRMEMYLLLSYSLALACADTIEFLGCRQQHYTSALAQLSFSKHPDHLICHLTQHG